eukprot:gb/GEZN01022571.1/.p1 GENE.gb/GEZN01022571.1/~~gb/GEZN01022571.1/.p1  ORF type:complete len:184 (+),score=11.38 gb/GEZN01022571.1/:67-552(+)
MPLLVISGMVWYRSSGKGILLLCSFALGIVAPTLKLLYLPRYLYRHVFIADIESLGWGEPIILIINYYIGGMVYNFLGDYMIGLAILFSGLAFFLFIIVVHSSRGRAVLTLCCCNRRRTWCILFVDSVYFGSMYVIPFYFYPLWVLSVACLHGIKLKLRLL